MTRVILIILYINNREGESMPFFVIHFVPYAVMNIQQTREVIIMRLQGPAIYSCESCKHRLVCAR